MDDNSLRWLGTYSTLTWHGRVRYVKATAERLNALMSPETRDYAAAANTVIESFEMDLCGRFDLMAAALLEMSTASLQMNWERTIEWCDAELAKPDHALKDNADDQ